MQAIFEPLSTPLLAGSITLFLSMSLIWAVSIRLKDVSIVDRVWGLTFILQALVYYIVAQPPGWRPLLLLVLITIWGTRLSLHIHIRNRGKPEDARYQRMRQHHGEPKFLWYSFFSVFMLQGFLSLLIGTPLLFVISIEGSDVFTIWDLLGSTAWFMGFYFEAVSDWQLTKFKRQAENKGKLLTKGLWSLSRHPNYFGDACLWWGYFFLAVSVPGGSLTIISPILMTLLIRFVSGVSLLERDLTKAKPGYEDYVRDVPPFFPRSFVWVSAQDDE